LRKVAELAGGGDVFSRRAGTGHKLQVRDGQQLLVREFGIGVDRLVTGWGLRQERPDRLPRRVRIAERHIGRLTVDISIAASVYGDTINDTGARDGAGIDVDRAGPA
jgi:hypothetical protein